MKRPTRVLHCEGLARWLLAMALTVLSCAGSAAEPLRLADDQASIDLWPAVTLLSDPEHSLDERSVLTRLADFRPPASPHANLGVRRDTVHNTYRDVFRETDSMTRGWITAIQEGRPARPDFADGLAVQRVLDAAVESSKSGGVHVPVTPG